MKLGAMRRDVLEALFQPPITEKYPFERHDPPERLRGLLTWSGANCTGCGLCAKDCPAVAIEMIVLDRKAKRFVLRYHIDQCTFCGQCVESCRQGCLTMAGNAWELAAYDKSAAVVFYGDENDIHEVMAGVAAGNTGEDDSG